MNPPFKALVEIKTPYLLTLNIRFLLTLSFLSMKQFYLDHSSKKHLSALTYTYFWTLIDTHPLLATLLSIPANFPY